MVLGAPELDSFRVHDVLSTFARGPGFALGVMDLTSVCVVELTMLRYLVARPPHLGRYLAGCALVSGVLGSGRHPTSYGSSGISA